MTYDENDPEFQAYAAEIEAEMKAAPYGRDSDGEPLTKEEYDRVLRFNARLNGRLS